MAGRIEATFERLAERGEKALVSYLCAGDPSMEETARLMATLVAAGADVIELGVPYSDPVADGPVVQRANQRALEAGADLEHIFEAVQTFRERDKDTPVILRSYINPLMAHGLEETAREARRAGVDGFQVVDLPFEEAEEFAEYLGDKGLILIQMISPNTSDERAQEIANRAEGFIYQVSLTGVTGTELEDFNTAREAVERIRRYTSLPICVGFGISAPEDAERVASWADGIVVGSALVWLIEGRGAQLHDRVRDFAMGLKTAMATRP